MFVHLVNTLSINPYNFFFSDRYPIKESILSFVIISVGTVYGIVFTYVGGMVVHGPGVKVAGFVFAGLYGVGLICVLLVKGRLKRLMVDSKSEQR